MRFVRFETALTTRTQACRIVRDAGKGFIKALGNLTSASFKRNGVSLETAAPSSIDMA
jgi:hypothetical protein